MDVILADEITRSQVVANNAPEYLDGEAEWADQAWPAGSLVARSSTGRIYRAVYSVPAGSDPPEKNIADAMLPFWQDLRPMNKLALFDARLGTQTMGPEGDLILTVLPGAISTIWIGNIYNVTAVHAVVKDRAGGLVVFEANYDLRAPVTSWWEWWFAPFSISNDLLISNIPAYRACEVTITLVSGGVARVGMVALGSAEHLGCAEWGPETDYRNYAAKQLDQQWGPSEGTGGVVTRDQNYTVHVPPVDAPRVSRFMEKAMRRPAVWIPHGDPRFEGIRGFGQAVDARMQYPNPGQTILSISVRGFI